MSTSSDPAPAWAVYDEMGERYETHSSASAYNAHYDRPAMLEQIGDVTGLDVLDAGCGAGFYTSELLDRGAASLTAFDGSAEMVAAARARVGDRATVDRLDFDDPLPYADASFDLVVSALAIHYARDRAATLREWQRVLRPGGRCVLSTQHPIVSWLRKGGSYFDVVEEMDVWRRPEGDHEVHFWREPIGALCAAATGAGFLIAGLVEPLPAASMRERWPDDDAELRQRPGFLILDLVTPGA